MLLFYIMETTLVLLELSFMMLAVDQSHTKSISDWHKEQTWGDFMAWKTVSYAKNNGDNNSNNNN